MGKERNGTHLELVRNEDNWFLCPDAEPRLTRSIKEGRIALINGIFLVKGEGGPAGVALRSKKVKGGIIIPSQWYEPVDWSIIIQVHKAINTRGGQSLNFPGSAWICARELRDEISDFGAVTTRNELFREVRRIASEIRNGSSV